MSKAIKASPTQMKNPQTQYRGRYWTALWLLIASCFLCPTVYGDGEFQGQTFTQTITAADGPSGLEHNPRSSMEGFHKVLFSGSIMNGLTKGIFDQYRVSKVFVVAEQDNAKDVIPGDCVVELSREDIQFSYGVNPGDGLSDYWFEWNLKSFEDSNPSCLQNGEWADGDFSVTMEWEFDIGGTPEFFFDEDYRLDFIVDTTPPVLAYEKHIEFPDYEGIVKSDVVSNQPIRATLQCGDNSRCLCSSNIECADPNGGVDRNAFTVLGNFCDTDSDGDGEPNRLCDSTAGKRTFSVWDTAGNSTTITPDFFHYDSVAPTLSGMNVRRFPTDMVVETPDGDVNNRRINLDGQGVPAPLLGSVQTASLEEPGSIKTYSKLYPEYLDSEGRHRKTKPIFYPHGPSLTWKYENPIVHPADIDDDNAEVAEIICDETDCYCKNSDACARLNGGEFYAPDELRGKEAFTYLLRRDGTYGWKDLDYSMGDSGPITRVYKRGYKSFTREELLEGMSPEPIDCGEHATCYCSEAEKRCVSLEEE